MEKQKIDEISSNVISYMASVKGFYPLVEEIVRATTEMRLTKKQRKDYVLGVFGKKNQEHVMNALYEAEEKLEQW